MYVHVRDTAFYWYEWLLLRKGYKQVHLFKVQFQLPVRLLVRLSLHVVNFFPPKHIYFRLFLISSYFSGGLSLTVLNKKKRVCKLTDVQLSN